MTCDIVVPTIREEQIKTFLESWNFKDPIVVWDNEDTYSQIEKDFGKDAWIFSRKNAAIRCYGYLKSNADVILTLDDDCLPVYHPKDEWGDISGPEYLSKYHIDNLIWKGSYAWEHTGIGRTRGLPYDNFNRKSEVMLSHGLWVENPDLDAINTIAGNTNFEPYNFVIPKGKYFPMCSMNLAFRKEIKTLMYMPLMGEGQPFDRWDDIWCGVMAKKVLDHLNLAVWSGVPYVQHSRKSNKWSNLMKESRGNGYEINEIFWERVDEVVLTKGNIKDCYIELSEKFNLMGDYWDKLKEAMVIWAELC